MLVMTGATTWVVPILLYLAMAEEGQGGKWQTIAKIVRTGQMLAEIGVHDTERTNVSASQPTVYRDFLFLCSEQSYLYWRASN